MPPRVRLFRGGAVRRLQGTVQPEACEHRDEPSSDASEPLPDRDQVVVRPGVQLEICEHGVGSPGAKTSGYNEFAAPQTAGQAGFKVFYQLDTPAMTEREVMLLNPPPLVVMYQ